MARICSNCDAGVPEGGAYCPNCGKELAPPSEEMPTQARTSVQRDASSSRAASSTQASMPEESGETAERSNSTPSQEPSAGGLLSGGAMAGVLAVLVLLAVGALIYFSLIRQGLTDQQGGGGTTVREQNVDEAATVQPSPAPNNGSLDQLVQEQVGDFTLRDKAELPEDVDAGADEALVMTYAAPDGTELTNYLFGFSSPEEADLALRSQVQNAKTEGFEQVGEGNITNPEGQNIGSWVELKQGDTTVMHWTNNSKYAVIGGPEGYIDEFYAAVSAYY